MGVGPGTVGSQGVDTDVRLIAALSVHEDDARRARSPFRHDDVELGSGDDLDGSEGFLGK